MKCERIKNTVLSHSYIKSKKQKKWTNKYGEILRVTGRCQKGVDMWGDI